VVCGIGYVAINSATKAHRQCRQNSSKHPITSPAAAKMIPSAARASSFVVGVRPTPIAYRRPADSHGWAALLLRTLWRFQVYPFTCISEAVFN
jgi:hypothetical protein